MPVPVVLLHGWGGSFATTWVRNGWVDALARAGRVVWPIDLPGHGGTASRDPASYGDLAGTVLGALPDGPLALIGYSLGAKLALAAAIRAPGRVASLVIGGVGDNLFAPERQGEALARAMEKGPAADAPPALVDLVASARSSGGDPAALAAVLRRPPNPVILDGDLARLPPVLLVNGDQDRLAQPDTRLRHALDRPDYLLLSGVDHGSLPADPAFRRAALAFLERQDG